MPPKSKPRFLMAALVCAALVLGSIGSYALATADVTSVTAWAQMVGGIFKTTPSTLSDGERDALRLKADGSLSTTTVGDVAHDAADAGRPVKIGAIGRAIYESAASTAGDRVNASADLYGRIRVVAGGEANSWYIVHAPVANTQATISKAAGTSSQRHVATGISWSLSSGAGAPTPELITIVVRDGATGAGTVMWTETVSLPAVAGSSARGSVAGLWLVGTAATALTIETDSAPGANVVANVSLNGVTIPN